jgi:hypothetical protein
MEVRLSSEISDKRLPDYAASHQDENTLQVSAVRTSNPTTAIIPLVN